MSHWNHRVIEFRQPDGTKWLAVHEVHYDDAEVPYAFSERAAGVDGESPEEMLETLARMRAAIDKPALAETDFVGDA